MGGLCSVWLNCLGCLAQLPWMGVLLAIALPDGGQPANALARFGPQVRAIWPQLPRDEKLKILMKAGLVAPYHPSKSLHKVLFDPACWRRWIDPRLLQVPRGTPRPNLRRFYINPV